MKRSGFKRKLPKKAVKKPPRISLLKKKLWEECKRIIRERYNPYCYTCGAYLEGSARQTGHFIPSSVCSVEMRYSLDNLRIQCYRCNINLSGNWPAYEKHLKEEKGPDFPDALKAKNEQTKGRMYDVLWYQQKLDEYRQL